MGNKARLGVFCLMALAIGLARLIEVEYRPQQLGIAEAASTVEPVRTPAPIRVARGAKAAAVEAAKLPLAKPSKPAGRVYKVKPGDTLDRISQRVYGTRRHWRLIRDANKDRFPDPRRMRPGVELRIPPVPPTGR